MNCPTCGMENEDGTLYCACCGAPMPQGTPMQSTPQGMPYGAPMQPGMPYGTPMQPGMPQGMPYGAPMQPQAPKTQKPPRREKTKQEKRKRNAIILVSVLLMLLLAGGGIFLYIRLDNRKITINMNDYIDVSYDGYAGYGTAVVFFDYDRFEKDYKSKIRYTRFIGDVWKNQYGVALKNKEIKDMYDAYDSFCEMVFPQVDFETDSDDEDDYDNIMFSEDYVYPGNADGMGKLSQKTSLDNGDTITFAWSVQVDEKALRGFNVTLEYSDVEFEVAGLEKLGTMDMFAGVNVTFEGYAPNGSANLEANTDDYYLEYTIDKTEGLSNGDKVVVTVSYNKAGEDLAMYCVENYQKLPESETKEFTVEGLPSYAMKIDEVSDDMKTKMDQKVRAEIEEDKSEKVTLNSVDLLGYYMLTDKGMDAYFSCNTMFYLVYKITATGTDGIFTYYYYGGFEDVTILADGTQTADLDDCSTPSNHMSYDHYNYGVYGYDTLDAVFKKCVTDKIQDYDYESSVQEQ